MARRVAWVAFQAGFLVAVVGGALLAVHDRRWILAVLYTYLAANVVWSLNWLPGRPGRLGRFLRRDDLRAERPTP